MKKLLAAVVSVMVVATACGGGDKTDLAAFCDFVREGVGISASNVAVRAAEYEQLLEVAPKEIRDALNELRNTTRSLDDIEELDQLFDAAFDPDAQAARDAFRQFAVDTCGVSGDALPQGRIDSTANLVADIRSYLDDNFDGAAWVPKVRYDVERQDGALHAVAVTFVVDAQDDEATQACAALAVYLYEIRGAEGPVTVIDDGLVVVRRDGPEAACEPV